MDKTNISAIETDDDGNTAENFFFMYSEEEKQQHEINEINAKKVFLPEFIPYYPAIKKQFDLSDIETLLYGFIRFYLANSSDRFYFTNEQLANLFSVSTKTISLAIGSLNDKEIIKTGYRIKSGGGQIRFISNITIVHSPTGKNVTSVITKGNGNNNKIKENKINNNTNIYSKPSLQIEQGKEINELIAQFKPVNPSYKTLFANKTQRGALQRMIQEHGLDKMTLVISRLPEIMSQEYAPRITTPLELEQKFGKLIIHLQIRERSIPKVANISEMIEEDERKQHGQ
jgi:hypothetical protein